MTQGVRADLEMRKALPATLPAVEEFCAEFRQWSQARLDGGTDFVAELLLREALTNAAVHGCRSDPQKQIRCCLRFKGQRFLIAVADDGDGFPWRAVGRNVSRFPDCSGRGIEILRRYASWVRYNERGNAVTMIVRFGKGK